MAETLTKVIVNCETGETEVLPLTAKEIEERKILAEKFAADQAKLEAENKAKDEAKASALAKLAALGLTEEEANALVK